jgi:hypothetical protein
MSEINWSRGQAHSSAIKRSPGWDRWCRERQSRLRARSAPQPDPAKGWLLLAEAAWGKLDIGAILIRASRYDDVAIQQQLREHWLAGYVAALRDVKRERERMEEAAYEAAMPQISLQEAAAVSHEFHKEANR